MSHEASLHDENAFLTLTYDENHVPADGGLRLEHFQNFMKRLRRKVGRPVRFYHCGEYGSKNARPHYHAIIFGYGFPDKEISGESRDYLGNSNYLYESRMLNECWPHGLHSIGEANYQSAAYTARYIVDKLTDDGDERYRRVHSSTGEVTLVPKEYATMSRRPGIGFAWYQKYKWDIYPNDYIVLNGKRWPVPRYYDKLFEEEHPEIFLEVVDQRKEFADQHWQDNQPERLAQRETCINARLSLAARDKL